MLPEELRALREHMGWTQQRLADGLGMSRKAVEMEGGKSPIERRTNLAVRYLVLTAGSNDQALEACTA